MNSFSHWVQLLMLFAIVVFLLSNRELLRCSSEQLRHELSSRFFVFSAETTRGKEAEFISERLPRRLPKTLIALLALGVFCAVAWWLMS